MKKNIEMVVGVLCITLTIILMWWLWPTATPEKKGLPKIVGRISPSSTHRTFGPEWKKIQLVQGEWVGPLQIRGGSRWETISGEIIVRVFKKGGEYEDHQDNEKKHLRIQGEGVSFLAVSPAVIFFRY